MAILSLGFLIPAILLWMRPPVSEAGKFVLNAFKIIVSGVVLVLMLLVLIFYWPRSPHGSSQSEWISEQPSPDGKYVAAVFVDSPGATTVGMSTYVSLRPKAEAWNPGKNRVVLEIEEKPEINLAWHGGDELDIEHGHGAVDIKAAKWNGITISDISPGYIPGPVAIGQSHGIDYLSLFVACVLTLSIALFWIRGGRSPGRALFVGRVLATVAWVALCGWVLLLSTYTR